MEVLCLLIKTFFLWFHISSILIIMSWLSARWFWVKETNYIFLFQDSKMMFNICIFHTHYWTPNTTLRNVIEDLHLHAHWHLKLSMFKRDSPTSFSNVTHLLLFPLANGINIILIFQIWIYNYNWPLVHLSKWIVRNISFLLPNIPLIYPLPHSPLHSYIATLF